MANANSTIEIELEIKQALDRLNRLERELQKSAQQMQKAADATGKLEGALNKAKTAAAGLFAFFSGQQIVEAADQFTNFANAVRISTSSVAEQTAVQKELYRVAQTTGSSLGDISKLYGRLRQAADQLGSSQAETIKITEIVGKALAASGTSASEASGALLQLAQALNSPRVQAEEFNSLVDAMPNLLRQVERQLGITAGGLKKFVTDGQLSNKLFRDAILGSAAAIDDQFGKANDTIATALTRLNNAFILLVGNFEESTGFFNKTAAVISGLAENMEELARVLKAVAVGFAIAFAPKVIRAIRDTATAMATLGAASKTNVIGALAALGFYIADITGGLDLLTEKLGLTKDASEETADAIADLTKASGGGVAAITPVVPQPSQEYLTSLENIREFFGNEAANSQFILQQLEQYSNYTSQILSDAATGAVDQIKSVNGEVLTFNQAVEESRHVLQLLGLAYEQALGREAGESANVLALQFLAAQQAMKVLLDLRDQELAVIAEVEARIAAINERGIERTESERIILRYQNEIAEVMADETFSLSQRKRIVKALESARDRELENAKEVLSFQEMITDELQTQLGLSKKAAKAAVSGYFGAGPSASRAGNILQSKSLEEAAYKLIFSNEKVASAINEQFEMLFDLIDPLIDILADLQAAINRLIKALLNAGQGLLDTVGLGQDSYLFGGGFAKDIESLFGGSRAPRGPSATENLLAAASQNLTSEATVEALQASFDRYGTAAIDTYLQSIEKERLAILSLTTAQKLRIEQIEKEIEILSTGDEDVVYQNLNQIGALKSELFTLTRDYHQALSGFNDIATLSAAIIDDLLIPSIEGVVDKIINYADPLLADFAEQAGAEALAAQEGISVGQALIQYRNDEQLALIETQRALAEYITDLEEKTRILGELSAAEQAIIELNALQIQQFTEASNALTDAAIADIERRGLVFSEQQEIEYRYAKEIAAAQENTNLTTADQIRLVNALEAARQREIDALEREADLLRLTNLQQALISLFDDFEEGLVQIREVVDGLVQQIQDLLFSEFNLDPVRDKLSLASESYQDLLAKALDPDATEEDVQAFQQFVNTYLTSARDVFKSSTAYRDIFDQVLTDLQSLGLAYGENAPINLIEDIQEQLRSLEVEFGENLQLLIDELDRLATAFRSQSLEFDGSINVDLGSINASFDSTPFLNAINQLNIDIANAINALVTTIGDASDAITDTGDGGTVTPPTVTPTPTPSTTLSEFAASGSAASAGAYSLDIATQPLGYGEIYTPGMASGTAADWAAAFVAEVQAAYPGQDTLMDYGIFAKSPTMSSFIGISEASSQYAQQFYDFLKEQGYSLETIGFTPASSIIEGLAQAYGNAAVPSGVRVNSTEAYDRAYYYDMISHGALAKKILTSVATPKTSYGIGIDAFGWSYLFSFDSLSAANSEYADFISQGYTASDITKYGFRQGGLVPDPMDTIPAMLSPGEYILSPETVRRFGVSSLNQLNSGDASAISQTNDPEVKRLLAELIQAVRESDTEVNVYTDMRGQAKAAVEEFRSEIKERSRRQGDQFIPVRYI